jgi:MoaA/NifB/PqqE/SkfB family radical SAM enzyme
MFKKVYLEISNICNVQCSFCPVVEKDKKLMDLAEFEAVLKEVVPLAEIVCLHLLGEPLAHPRFSEILDICERYNTQIDLTTNGILIKRYTERILNARCIRQVNFSIQAFKDNFPERDLDPYLLPIVEFTKSAHALRPELYVNYRLWNQQSNDSDNEDVFLKLESYFDVAINRKC